MGAELYDYFGLQKSSELFLQLMRAQYDESCRTFKHVENCYLECQKQLNVSEEKYNRLLAENQDLIATVEDLTNTNVALKDFIDKIQKEKMSMLKQLDATQSKFAELKQIAKNLQQPQNTIINDEAEAERYLQLLNKGIDKTTKKMDENDTVELRTLVEGLKDYAEETSIEEAHQLFLVFCMLLSDVPAWTKNVKPLRRFFADLKKKKKTGISIDKNYGNVVGEQNGGHVNARNGKGGTNGNND